jgi:hypothetical protein
MVWQRFCFRVGNRKPTQKTHPDFFKFLIFYENKTYFSGFFPTLFCFGLHSVYFTDTVATREVSGEAEERNVEIENAGCCNDCNTYLPQKASRCLKVLTNEKRGVLTVQ